MRLLDQKAATSLKASRPVVEAAAVDEVRAKTTAFDKGGEGAKDRLFGRSRYAP
jgi:hypothetical protein